jgi:hypothetical protein
MAIYTLKIGIIRVRYCRNIMILFCSVVCIALCGCYENADHPLYVVVNESAQGYEKPVSLAELKNERHFNCKFDIGMKLKVIAIDYSKDYMFYKVGCPAGGYSYIKSGSAKI